MQEKMRTVGNFCQGKMADISYRGEKGFPEVFMGRVSKALRGYVTGGKILLGWLLSTHLIPRQLVVRVPVLRESD
jgi:hypothetical protein